MGLVYVKGKVSNNQKEAELRFLVDGRANYTFLPENRWKYLGLKPKRSTGLVLADGSVIELKNFGFLYWAHSK